MSEEAPKNNLLTWKECAMRIGNKKYLTDIGAMKDGIICDDFYHDSLLPSRLHEFIYEYDGSDPFRSAWFLHRLELALNEAKQEANEYLQSQLAESNRQRDELREYVADIKLICDNTEEINMSNYTEDLVSSMNTNFNDIKVLTKAIGDNI